MTQLTCLTCGSDNTKRGLNRRRTAHITKCKSCHVLEESPHGRDWRAFAPSHSRAAEDARASAGAGSTAASDGTQWIGAGPSYKGAGKGYAKDSLYSLLAQATRRAFPSITSRQVVFYSNPLGPNTFFGFDPARELSESEPPKIPSAGVTVGELIGWRFWLIQDGQIRSVVSGKPWEPNADQTRAAMEGDVNELVMRDWVWGRNIYGGCFAWKTEDQARTHMQEAVDHYLNTDVEIIAVMGQVELWGDVIDHERGYRAQYARPLSFINTHSNRPGDLSRDYLLDRLREIWGME